MTSSECEPTEPGADTARSTADERGGLHLSLLEARQGTVLKGGNPRNIVGLKLGTKPIILSRTLSL